MFLVKSLLIGIVAGFICGLLGIGGGSILVPLLFYFFSLSIKRTIGTSLLIITISSLSGVFTHWKGKQVYFKLSFFIVISGIFGTQIGAYLTSILSENIVKIFFILVVVILGIKMWKDPPYDEKDLKERKEFAIWKSLIIGFSGGVVSGLCGVGGAILVTPLMYIFLKIPINICIGTTLVGVFFNSLSGSIAYMVRKLTEIKIGIFTGISSILGAYYGARLSLKLPRKTLRRIFSIVLIVGGISMLFKR